MSTVVVHYLLFSPQKMIDTLMILYALFLLIFTKYCIFLDSPCVSNHLPLLNFVGGIASSHIEHFAMCWRRRRRDQPRRTPSSSRHHRNTKCHVITKSSTNKSSALVKTLNWSTPMISTLHFQSSKKPKANNNPKASISSHHGYLSTKAQCKHLSQETLAMASWVGPPPPLASPLRLKCPQPHCCKKQLKLVQP